MCNLYEFGPYRFNVEPYGLWRGEEPVTLTGKQFQVLHAIAKGEGKVVQKDTIIKEAWPGRQSPNEPPLSRHVSDINSILSPCENDFIYLRNVSGEGYYIRPVKARGLDEGTGSPAVRPLDVAEPLLGDLNAGGVRNRKWLFPIMAAIALVALCIVASRSVHLTPRPREEMASSPVRSIGLATSEGGSPLSRQIGFLPGALLVTPDSRYIYAVEENGRGVLVLNAADLTVEATLSLPSNGHRAVMSPDGKRIYIGSLVDGIMVIHTGENRAEDLGIRTAGPVWDLDVAADGSKAYLALGSRGLKEVDLGSRKVESISPEPSPQFLRIDHSGRQLFVSYQDGGPGGSLGHDALIVYDLNDNYKARNAPRLRRVGGPVELVPWSSRILLDEWNACSGANYDPVECPHVGPSRVLHVLSTTDLSLVKTLALPATVGGECAFSPDGKLCAFAADSLVFYDIVLRKIRERYSPIGRSFRRAAFSPDGKRVFAAVDSHGSAPAILMFQTGISRSPGPDLGLINLYSGDGTFDDGVGAGSADARGTVDFGPGMIGQAFHFRSGKGGFVEIDPVDSCLECENEWTIRLYLKLGTTGGEATILDREQSEGRIGYRLYEVAEGRLVLGLKSDDRGAKSISSPGVVAGKWYRIDLVSDGRAIDMFLDGVSAGRVMLPARNPFKTPWGRVFLGGTPAGADLDGWIDEVAFYDRALTPNEIGR